MKKVSVVIPTKYEKESVLELYNRFDLYRIVLRLYGGYNIKIIFVDDTPNDDIKKISDSVSWFEYIDGKGSYGESVKYGLIRNINSDVVVMMDADHPITYLSSMLNMLEKYDVVVGIEDKENKERFVTKFLCNKIMKINLEHPTCGFIGFNNDSINKIKFYKILSTYDVSHVELLHMCRKNNMNIGELKFTPYRDITHSYNIKRYFKWLWDFGKMFLATNIVRWYD